MVLYLCQSLLSPALAECVFCLFNLYLTHVTSPFSWPNWQVMAEELHIHIGGILCGRQFVVNRHSTVQHIWTRSRGNSIGWGFFFFCEQFKSSVQNWLVFPSFRFMCGVQTATSYMLHNLFFSHMFSIYLKLQNLTSSKMSRLQIIQ